MHATGAVCQMATCALPQYVPDTWACLRQVSNWSTSSSASPLWEGCSAPKRVPKLWTPQVTIDDPSVWLPRKHRLYTAQPWERSPDGPVCVTADDSALPGKTLLCGALARATGANTPVLCASRLVTGRGLVSCTCLRTSDHGGCIFLADYHMDMLLCLFLCMLSRPSDDFTLYECLRSFGKTLAVGDNMRSMKCAVQTLTAQIVTLVKQTDNFMKYHAYYHV